MSSAISVVIPTWNGLHLLRQHLPSVIEAARVYRQRTGAATELIVVDDGSSDATVDELPGLFPEARLICRSSNSGFGVACNEGFEHCRYPLVALLNNDVDVEPDYLLRQVEQMQGDDVFAVTSRVFECDPPIFATGGKVARFRKGFWSVYFNYDEPESSGQSLPLLSAYAVGGFALFDREKLERLGGFDELLTPFHWEDVDLSYRAWKRGWEVRYAPASIAYHEISATIDAHYSKKKVSRVALRNRLLFHWINLHSPGFVAAHFGMLLLLLLSRWIVLDVQFYGAFWEACRRLPQALQRRRRERRLALRSDADVAKCLGDFYKMKGVRVYQGREQVLREHPGLPLDRRTPEDAAG